MPIPLPDLDDRSYAELTAEALALIPGLCPAWTDFNPSDPGITLTELLAWLTEMLLYQVNQVPPASTGKFLQLLNPPGWAGLAQSDLDTAIRQTITSLRTPYRAVTAADYEWLALNAWPQSAQSLALAIAPPAAAAIARVACIPQCDLTAADPAAEAPAHISLVVLTQAAAAAATAPPAPATAAPGPGSADSAASTDGAVGTDGTDGAQQLQQSQAALCAAMAQFLDPRRTLTTRHHVVPASFLPVFISANLALRADAPADQALAAAQQALTDWYDPLTGGPDGSGWPFGRAVYPAEAAAVLQSVALVDYVEDVQVAVPGAAPAPPGGGGAVELAAGQLVQLQPAQLVAYDAQGHSYPQPGGTG